MNCNTTHYRANSSSVPGDPTEAIAPVVVGFAEAEAQLRHAAEHLGGVDVVVVETPKPAATPQATWQDVLDSHRTLAADVIAVAAWARAALRYNTDGIRLIHYTAAASAAGRSTAQSVAQLVRSAQAIPEVDNFTVFTIAVESDDLQPLAALTTLLATDRRALELGGAELMVSRGWLGLRSHPRAAVTLTFPGPSVPDWINDALRQSCEER